MRGRPFKFLNFMVTDERFIPIIQDVWQSNRRGCELRMIWDNLKQGKQELKALHSMQFSQAHKKVAKLRYQPDQVQLSHSVRNSEEAQLKGRETIEKLRYWS